MEKAQLLNKIKNVVLVIVLIVSFSCKKEVKFIYNESSFVSDPLSVGIIKNKVKEFAIYKVDSLNNIDSSSARKIYFNSVGQIVMFEDKPAFSTSLKINYQNKFPINLYCLTDYALEYSCVSKTDSLNKKIVLYWKDEFKKIEDSTEYFFDENSRLKKVNNDLDFYNFYIRKKLGNGVFKINFNTELSYNSDSLISQKRIIYNLKNIEFKGIIPDSSLIKYTYNNQKELLKATEMYYFPDNTSNFMKEVFYQRGLPVYHLINGNKYVYQFKY